MLPATSTWPSGPTRPNSQRTARSTAAVQLLVGEVEQPDLEIQRRDGLVAGIGPALFEKHAVAGAELRHRQIDEAAAELLQLVIVGQHARQPVGQGVEQQAVRGVGVVAFQAVLVARLGEPAGRLVNLRHELVDPLLVLGPQVAFAEHEDGLVEIGQPEGGGRGAAVRLAGWRPKLPLVGLLPERGVDRPPALRPRPAGPPRTTARTR